MFCHQRQLLQILQQLNFRPAPLLAEDQEFRGAVSNT